MLTTPELLDFSKWLGIATLALAALTVLAFVLNWGIRFRLVGITAFTGVLAGGVFALGLGLFQRVEIPGAVRYSRVFDDGARQIVIVVAPDITESQLEATLQQAASDLYSPGRGGAGQMPLVIRARTIVHPQPGVSEPIFLGRVQRVSGFANQGDVAIAINQESLNHLQTVREATN
ncbi:Ycf51 family protein [Limnospira fusiformis]|uniref:Ycf51 family protein n=1 Tax=Limnospira fusiformis TaxID=54297 RepID=UPI002AA1EA4C|nr:Ycf51 family protein [Limnospira fusiformis LS22]